MVSINLSGSLETTDINYNELEDEINQYWSNLPFELPFYNNILISGNDCHLEIDKFLSSFPIYEGNTEEAQQFVDDTLNEAVTLKQWTIPFGAYLQFDFENYNGFKIFEVNKDVFFLLFDNDGKYIKFSVDPYYQTFTTSFLYRNKSSLLHKFKSNEELMDYLDRLIIGINVLISSIIRDFWVIEDRFTLFGNSTITRKRPKSKEDNDKPTIHYLPRIKYIQDVSKASENLDYKSRREHFVSGHLRKALHASIKQVLIAKKLNISIPEGFTFVQPHKRGEEAKEKIFRSRSVLKLINSLDLYKVKNRSDLWFTYELNVKNWLKDNGYEVLHISGSKNGDGGVDIQAYKDNENLLIQCKYWKDPVGMSVIREMLGTLVTYPDGSMGVIITSSHLTKGAKKLAIKKNIQFIEEADFKTNLNIKIN